MCLSSTEAEYVAMSTLIQDVRFEQQLLDEIAEQEHLYPSISFYHKIEKLDKELSILTIVCKTFKTDW